jgi:hypothetical protein
MFTFPKSREVRGFRFTVGLCVIGFGAVTSLAADALPKTDVPAEFVDHLQALLDLGAGRDPKSAPQAKHHFLEASRLRPNDPRVEFAYALVLTRLFKSVEAKEHLHAAAERVPAYFPARQAAIRDLVKSQKYQAAGEELSELARSLSPTDPASAERAEWIGRVVACVSGPVGSKDARQQFEYLHSHLSRSLPAVIDAAYERGYEQLLQEVDELRSSIELVQSTSRSKAEEAKAGVEADLVARRTELKAKQDDARNTSKKWDDWATDETRKIDETLKEMEKQYGDLENSATALTSSITALRLQLDRIDRGIVPDTTFLSSRFMFSGTTTSRQNVERQQLLEEQKLNLVYSAQMELSNRAGAQLGQRKAIVAEYQNATGQVMKELDTLKNWDLRAKKQAERAKKAADKKPAGLASLEARVRSLNTYDPFNFTLERERLLAEFGVVAAIAPRDLTDDEP